MSEYSIIDYNITLNLLLYSILIYNLNKELNNNSIEDLINNIKSKNDKIFLNKYLINNIQDDKIIKIFYCDITHIHCIIIKDSINKKIKIIFKGTTDEKHIEYNLKIKLRKIKFLNEKIKIHNGFYQQVFRGNLYNKIIKYLNDQDIDNYLIFYSGHSLGGIMATLFGYFSSFIFTKNKIIITSFGSSKIGNKYFKNSFESRNNIICYRIINNDDIIIKLPFGNYEHVGIPINLKSSSKSYGILENHEYKSYLMNLINSKW